MMRQKIHVTFVLLFLSSFIFCQTSSKDSLKRQFDSIKLQVDSLNKQISGCTELRIHEKPKWVSNIKTLKTYYRNCMWSATYIVLNKDSTFLFKHIGEGLDYLQKGKWAIKSDNILILTSIKGFTKYFRRKMKKVEKIVYNTNEILLRQYLIKPDMLVQIEGKE